MPFPPRGIGPWRRGFQLSLAASLAIIPFLGGKGQAWLRLDIPTLTLELLGHQFRIEELYLVWLFVLGGIFVFLLITLTLGRVWCGWACPQTALSDLLEWLNQRRRRPWRHLLTLIISLWAGATFVCYFVPPLDYFSRLVNGQLGGWPLGTTLVVAAVVFADFTLVGRLFCREFCPYGRFQSLLVDRGTLCLQAPASELRRCIDCQSCLRACPTGIDIRHGYQIECINCARCLDACRRVMARRGQAGIIRYTFGLDDLGWRALVSAKRGGLALLVIALTLTTVFLASHRAAANFKIGRSSTLASRLTEAGQLTFFSGSITSRRQGEQHFVLSVSPEHDPALAIKGTTRFTLTGNEKRDISLAVESPRLSGNRPLPITFTLVVEDDGSRITVPAYLSPGDNTPKRK